MRRLFITATKAMQRLFKTIGVISIVALVATMISPVTAEITAVQSDLLVCSFALNSERSGWDLSVPEYVAEAARRGLSAAVYEMIDGRKSVSAHGPSEMPVWGFRYSPSVMTSIST